MKNINLNVAVIEPVGSHGGCNFYDFSLCRSLVRAGVRTRLYSCDKTVCDSGELFELHTPYRRIYGSDPSWKRGLRFLRGSIVALMGSRLNGTKIAHFHFYHVSILEFFNILLSRLLMMKVVITAHDVESFKSELSQDHFVTWSYTLAHAIIAHNEISKLELVQKLGVPELKIKVIRHGNHAEYFAVRPTRLEACKALDLDPDDFNIVFFGQIKEVKGLDILIKALPMVVQQSRRSVRLVIAGRVWKDDFSKYQSLIDELNLVDRVKLFIRYISDEELPAFYASADVMVLPYKRIYQSGVVLMAMTFGTPVMVSDIPGMVEVVTDGVTGMAFRSGDPDDLANKLIQAARKPEMLLDMASRAKQHMETEYDWTLIGQQTAECYRHILG